MLNAVFELKRKGKRKVLQVSGVDPEDLTVDVRYWFRDRINPDEKQLMFRRLLEAFSKPITEVYLLFYQATLSVFSTFNLLHQTEKSSIFLLHDEVELVESPGAADPCHLCKLTVLISIKNIRAVCLKLGAVPSY
ncbi:uncharacterized protein LOC127439360 isoform X2 [Myxocyprinus asiaticus]|uniref:uncharacterized protein LOC127439360 isoform X2 n=1 Tax=Myxocyprinus asiaticus TaxID=70543 RepID=UPI0022224100|nr:uncharacterized protein LOC127439360 isoform X2 [Myxocyprinus asiaticus]